MHFFSFELQTNRAFKKNEVIANCWRWASFCASIELFFLNFHICALSRLFHSQCSVYSFPVVWLSDTSYIQKYIAFGSVSLDFNFQFMYISIAPRGSKQACEHEIFHFSVYDRHLFLFAVFLFHSNSSRSLHHLLCILSSFWLAPLSSIHSILYLVCLHFLPIFLSLSLARFYFIFHHQFHASTYARSNIWFTK